MLNFLFPSHDRSGRTVSAVSLPKLSIKQDTSSSSHRLASAAAADPAGFNGLLGLTKSSAFEIISWWALSLINSFLIWDAAVNPAAIQSSFWIKGQNSVTAFVILDKPLSQPSVAFCNWDLTFCKAYRVSQKFLFNWMESKGTLSSAASKILVPKILVGWNPICILFRISS